METIYQKIGNQESLNFVRTRSVMKMPISKIAMYGKGKVGKTPKSNARYSPEKLYRSTLKKHNHVFAHVQQFDFRTGV